MKEMYQKLNEHITPGRHLTEAVMEQAAPRHRRLRPLALVAAVLALVMLAVPVMAANIPAVAELMYMVSPEVAARFLPVQKSCTNNGVTMEVVSASIHGAVVEVYLSFSGEDGMELDPYISAEGDTLLGRSVLLGSGSWGESLYAAKQDPETGKVFQMLEHDYSFYSRLLGRYLTVDEIYGGKMTAYVESIRWYDDAGEKHTIAGPWYVTFEIDESGYVGERDEGVPMITMPQE